MTLSRAETTPTRVKRGPEGGMRRTVRVLTRKLHPDGERCVLVEDGRPCADPAKSRGLCNGHLCYLRTHGRFEEFALPPKTSQDLKHRFEVKPAPEPGVCRLIVNGAPCARPGIRRGLCVRHYQSLWQRPDVSLDAYALPPLFKGEIRARRVFIEGTCRVHQEGADCASPAHARGLCQKHYYWLRARAPALFLRIAAPDPKARHYTLRGRLREGGCRVAVNLRGCGGPAEVRGLCQHHYSVLRSRPELLEGIALPVRTRVERRYERRPVTGETLTMCVVIENGLPCTRAPEHRGVCREHRRVIGNSPDYSLRDFYLPVSPPPLERKAPEELADGLCQVMESARACVKPPHVRGLCRRHYRMAAERQALDRLAQPVRGLHSPYGAGNDRPHVYLDKNVLFDHADARVFGAGGQAASAALVEHVIAGRARASVSADAIKSTYNHVRYRLQRPAEEGGRGLSPEEAEVVAREHIVRTFFATGAWRVIPFDAPAFARIARAPAAGLSLEDALEFEAYQSARGGSAGPTLFATRDTDFPEGVHPASLLRAWGW